MGQLPVTTDAGVLVAAKTAQHPDEPGGTTRDGTLFFDTTAGTMTSTGARWDGTRDTYWWGYTRGTPAISGWPARKDTSMAVVLCKLADSSRTPDSTAIRKTLLGRGQGGLRDYLFDTTYGTTDIAGADVLGWVTSTLKTTDSKNL